MALFVQHLSPRRSASSKRINRPGFALLDDDYSHPLGHEVDLMSDSRAIDAEIDPETGRIIQSEKPGNNISRRDQMRAFNSLGIGKNVSRRLAVTCDLAVTWLGRGHYQSNECKHSDFVLPDNCRSAGARDIVPAAGRGTAMASRCRVAAIGYRAGGRASRAAASGDRPTGH